MQKLYVPVVTLSAPYNINLFEQLEYGIKEQLMGINIYVNQQIKCETDT